MMHVTYMVDLRVTTHCNIIHACIHHATCLRRHACMEQDATKGVPSVATRSSMGSGDRPPRRQFGFLVSSACIHVSHVFDSMSMHACRSHPQPATHVALMHHIHALYTFHNTFPIDCQAEVLKPLSASGCIAMLPLERAMSTQSDVRNDGDIQTISA